MAVSNIKLKEWRDANEKAQKRLDYFKHQYGLSEKQALSIYQMPMDTMKSIYKASDKVVDERIENLNRLVNVRLTSWVKNEPHRVLNLDRARNKEETITHNRTAIANLIPQDEKTRIIRDIDRSNELAFTLAQLDKMVGKHYVKQDPYTKKLTVEERSKYDLFDIDDDSFQRQYSVKGKIIGKIYDKPKIEVKPSDKSLVKVRKTEATLFNFEQKWKQGSLSKERMKISRFRLLKDNILLGIENKSGTEVKKRLKQLISRKKITDIELYYLFKYRGVLAFDFIYEEADIDAKFNIIKSEIEKMRTEDKDLLSDFTKMLSPFISE